MRYNHAMDLGQTIFISLFSCFSEGTQKPQNPSAVFSTLISLLDHYVVSVLFKDVNYTKASQCIASAAGKMAKLQQISRDFSWILFNVFPLMGVTFQVVIRYLWMLSKAVLNAPVFHKHHYFSPFYKQLLKGKKHNAVLAHLLVFCCETGCFSVRGELQGAVCWIG